jgi:hypothetical protein
MIRCPGAKVPEAMLAKNFTLAESSNLAKRMAIRRAYKEAARKELHVGREFEPREADGHPPCL